MWRSDVSIADVIDKIVGGGTPVRNVEEFWNGEIPWASVKDISDNAYYISSTLETITQEGLSSSASNLIPPNTAIVCTRMSVGSSALTSRHIAINQDLKAVFANKGEIKAEYLVWQLKHHQEELDRKAIGSTVKGISVADLKNLRLYRPKIFDQEKIVNILEATDCAIEKTQALITKYENIKQGMMQDLFTRGVDENGQLRPSYEDAPHLYQETERGWVPKDWVTEELRYYVPRAEYGVSISCDDNAENIPVLRMNNIFNGEFEVSDLKYAPASELSGLFLKEKDVLFNRTNSWEHVGKTAIWKNQLAKASFASYMVRLIPDIELMIPEFLSYWLQLDDVQTAIRTFATPGVQQVNINPTNLRRTLCSAPKDTDEQSIIVSRVQAIDGKLKKEREILGKLKSQKLGLMQDLLTGKVRVAEDLDERKEAVA